MHAQTSISKIGEWNTILARVEPTRKGNYMLVGYTNNESTHTAYM